MLTLFAFFLVGQVMTGWYEFNGTLQEHGAAAIPFAAYLSVGHPWEALFENWESEFLQMAAFVLLTTFLYPEGLARVAASGCDRAGRRRSAIVRGSGGRPVAGAARRMGPEDLRALARAGAVPLFLASWIGMPSAAGRITRERPGAPRPDGDPARRLPASSRFWFESFQNWQSEFLSVAAMVWLSIFLRQRGSPESKPVHAPTATRDGDVATRSLSRACPCRLIRRS